MKLVNSKMGLEITFKENQVNVVVIERPEDMTYFIAELKKQCENMAGECMLYEEDPLNISKYVQILIDYFSLDINDKKVISKIYNELKNNAQNYIIEKNEINSKIIQLLDQLIRNSLYDNLSFELDFDWNNIFKIYNLRISNNFNSLIEKLIEYIKILSSLKICSILCCVNLKSYLSIEELRYLYEMASYYKISLLLIESHEYEKLSSESVLVFDKDRCVIVK